MRRACLVLLTAGLTLLTPGRAVSQTDAGSAGAEKEEMICLAVAHGWSGSLEETAHIRDIPVPLSFSRQLEGGGCTAWQLVRQSLVNWHLAYGDVKSATAALAYLEARATGGKPLRTKLSVASKGDVDIAESYRFVAMEYARAADFYASPALLAKARRFAGPSLAVAIALREPRADGTAQPLFDDYPDRLWRTLDLQLAVASVRIGGQPADFAAARAVFARNDDPSFDAAGNYAYDNGRGFCDIGNDSYRQAWNEACQDGDFEARALAYWRYRAVFSMLAIVAGDLGINKVRDEWDGVTAPRLLEGHARDVSDGLPELYFSDSSFALTDIRFAIAEAQLAKAAKTFAADPRPGVTRSEDETYYGLDQLWQASVYVRGSDHPGWLYRIGQRYLAGSAFLDRIRDPAEPLRSDHARRLAWLRTVLPRLDGIARGEVTP